MSGRERIGGCFGLEFTKCVVAAGITMAELARRCEVSQNHLGDLSRSERGPSPDLINQIAKELHLKRDQKHVLHRAAALDYGFEIGVLR